MDRPTPNDPRGEDRQASMQITIISMPNARLRRERISRLFAASPFSWKFMDASDGTENILPYDRKRAMQITGRDLTGPEKGAFESHVKALRDFVHEGTTETVLICEDDVFVDFDFGFKDLISAMNAAEIQYMRLYSRRSPSAKHIHFWRNRWLIRYRWEPFGMQCYIATRAGAQHLLSVLTSIYREVDQEIDRFWEHGVPLYSLFPHPVLELTSVSSIAVRNPSPSKLDYWGHRFRRLVDRFAAITASFGYRDQDRRFADALAHTDNR